MKRFFNTMVLAAALLATAFIAACDDDDDDKRLRMRDVRGEYAGTFDFVPTPGSLNPAPTPETDVAVALKVVDDKIVIPDFPAATLVKAILGEEAAAALIPQLGTVAYTAKIKDPISDTETYSASLDTPELRIEIGTTEKTVVRIDIEAPTRMVYAKNGKLTFTLKTTKCQIGEGATAGAPFDLVNTLTFDVMKK